MTGDGSQHRRDHLHTAGRAGGLTRCGRHPIVEEVRAIRTTLAARFDFDLQAMYSEVKRLEEASGRTFASYPPRLVRDATRAGTGADRARG